MSYQVLARKWRPKQFSELVGQQHIVTALSNALDNDRLHHAYLFTGTRGVGKTTLARIFAKSLNCQTGVTSTPCGKCSTCKEIDEGRFVDLLEVDAASRTKVEQTRDLLDNVPFAPVHGRYKVYLIDEVHMFSNNSFNALLKTLEEPPPHVKFILATTDPQKVPPTVLSRCLQFGLQRISPEEIFQQFQHILDEENIAFEVAALRLLAQSADGSMRDGLSLLDQSIGFGGGQVVTTQVQEMLGTVDVMQIDQLLTLIVQGNGEALLSLCGELYLQAVDFSAVLQRLTRRFHEIALFQSVRNYAASRFDDSDKLEQLSNLCSAQDLHVYYQIAIVGKEDLFRAPDFRSGFEMLMLRMLAFQPILETPTPSTEVNEYHAGNAEPVAQQTVQKKTPEDKKTVSRSIDGNAQNSEWEMLIDAMQLQGMCKQLANNCIILEKNDNKLKLGLDPSCENLRIEMVENKLIEAVQNHFSNKLTLEIQLLSDNKQQTPAKYQQTMQKQKEQDAEQAFLNDGLTRALTSQMGAEVISGSIKPETS